MTVAMAVLVMMPVAMPRRTRMFQLAIQFLYALAISSHNVSYVPYTVEVQLQLFDLLYQVREACDLGIGVVDDVACPIILLHCNYLTLLTQIVDALRDLLHQPVQMRRQGSQTCAIEKQPALGRCTARRS